LETDYRVAAVSFVYSIYSRLRGTSHATGTQFAKFDCEDNSIPPIATGSHLDTVATGGKFDDAQGRVPLDFGGIATLTRGRSLEVSRFCFAKYERTKCEKPCYTSPNKLDEQSGCKILPLR
jgi:hypothetical protein